MKIKDFLIKTYTVFDNKTVYVVKKEGGKRAAFMVDEEGEVIQIKLDDLDCGNLMLKDYRKRGCL